MLSTDGIRMEEINQLLESLSTSEMERRILLKRFCGREDLLQLAHYLEIPEYKDRDNIAYGESDKLLESVIEASGNEKNFEKAWKA